MRTIFKSALFCAIITLLIIGCKEDNNDLANVDYTFAFSLQNANGRISSDYAVKSILVSVTDNNGNEIYKLKEIKVYNFDGEFISEPISLIPGNYSVTDFLVIDENQNVVYVTPKSGSPLAYLVENPLPINFNIKNDQVNKINLEVIDIDDGAPNDFGYNTFSFSIVETFDFLTAVFVYDEFIQNFKLASANITVTNGGDTLFNKTISDSTNSIVLKSGVNEYKITVKKEGYPVWERIFTEEELTNYANQPLIIILDQDLYDGLVAWYPFNGNADDFSGNSNHGINYNAVTTTDRKGKLNSAYYFDGDDSFIEIVPESNVSSIQDFSISLWMKLDQWRNQIIADTDYPNTIDRQYVFCGHSNARDNYGDYFRPGFSVFTDLGVIDEDTTELITSYTKYSSYQLRDRSYNYSNGLSIANQWIHITYIRQGSEFSTYINGEQISYNKPIDNIDSDRAINMQHNWYIGTFSGNNPYFNDLNYNFSGKIDDVRIYDRPLTNEEIKKLFVE